MTERWLRGMLHLLIGGACAALVGWLAFAFTRTITLQSGPVQVAMVVLVVASVVGVGALLLSSSVRPAEVALARALLGTPLEDPVDVRSWAARGRGLAWAAVVLVLGGLSLVALLGLVPWGVALLIGAVDPGVRTGLTSSVGRLPAGVLALGGMLAIAAATLGQALPIGLLRHLAPRVLGPTSIDRLALAERERRRLLEANHLARELHDSIGHALTAIGVQAEAGARVAAADPEYARRALADISTATRTALGELDEVLGRLRAGAGAAVPPGGGPGGEDAATASVVSLLGPDGPRGSGAVVVTDDGTGHRLDAAGRLLLHRVVQEGVTNARRHGVGGLRGHVRLASGDVDVVLVNAVAGAEVAAAQPTGGGRGLAGLHERLELAGGHVEAGRVVVQGRPSWRLAAHWPAGVPA